MAKRINTLIFDMDGTLVEYKNKPFNSSWDVMAGLLSQEKREKWFQQRDFYLDKKEFYSEWYINQVALLCNLKLQEAIGALFPIPYSRGVRGFFSDKNSHRNNYTTGILTSGIDLVAEKIRCDFKMDFCVCASILEVNGDIFTGKGKCYQSLWEKNLDLLKVAREKNLNLQEILYVGDNENDIPVFELVGFPVAFKPKTKKTRDFVNKRSGFIINDFGELNLILDKYGNRSIF